MAKQTINIGTADQGNGDPLRTAFVKVNENFTELYEALGLTDNNLNLGSFQFEDNIMSTTDSSSIVIDQAVTINSELTTHGDIVPNLSNEHTLGTPTRQWKSLYVANQTIYIDNVPLRLTDSNTLTIDGKPLVTSGSDTTFYNLDGTEMSNADQAHGFTARMSLPANGDSEIPVIVQNNYGDVVISAGTDPGNTHLWTFSRNGNIIVPPGGDIKDSEGNSLLSGNEIDGGFASTDYTAEITVDGGGA